jgi:hypothetical protein
MHLDAAVAGDEAELAKAIRKATYAGPCGTDHLRQGLLRNPRNESLSFPGLPNSAIKRENSRQALFAGIEELVDKIGRGSHVVCQQELQEDVGERRFVMHLANHFVPPDFERGAGDFGSDRR